MYTTYIRDAGIAVVSRKIVERTGNIKWLFREVLVWSGFVDRVF